MIQNSLNLTIQINILWVTIRKTALIFIPDNSGKMATWWLHGTDFWLHGGYMEAAHKLEAGHGETQEQRTD
jgi:hypothetical protein